MSQENHIYCSNQASILFDYWDNDIKWFVVAGPADGDEARTVKEKYTDVSCICFEPHPYFRSLQEERGFPGIVSEYALWNCDMESLWLRVPNGLPRSGSICRDFGDCQFHKISIRTRALDTLSRIYGFSHVPIALWMDIEEAEQKALIGARNLLMNGDIRLINLEVINQHHEFTIDQMLKGYGYKKINRWNTQDQRADIIYKLL